ncbi:MAG: multidrug effflux MFS transporter [Pseudomonadota bacterium]
MRVPERPLSRVEFVALLALMTSIVAMSTDLMLPALGEIARELAAPGQNDGQLVITSLFLGLAAGQLLAGPLSDALGRRPVIFIGYGVFLVGTLLSLWTSDFTVMLVGRVLQGLGAAGPRVIATAVIRDCYQGRAMAQILSVITAVFILVPMVAPAIGQGIIYGFGWRATFGFLALVGLITLAWYWLRQPETLAPTDQRPFRPGVIWRGAREALSHRVTLGATFSIGFMFAPFIGYLSASQQIFQQTYATGAWFPLWFAAGALCFGAASLVNSRLVMRLGMRLLTRWALVSNFGCAMIFLAPVLLFGGVPPFWAFLAWLAPMLFCLGIGFGNLNALAMEPLGRMAGMGAALVGCISTLIALPFGWLVGAGYDGGLWSLVGGYAGFGFLSFLCFRWAVHGLPEHAGNA